MSAAPLLQVKGAADDAKPTDSTDAAVTSQQQHAFPGAQNVKSRSCRWASALCLGVTALSAVAISFCPQLVQQHRITRADTLRGAAPFGVTESGSKTVMYEKGGVEETALHELLPPASASRVPTTAESVALVDAMDTDIGNQVAVFDHMNWEKLYSKFFAWGFTYWYSYPRGSEAWQYTGNPYTDRNPSNPFEIEVESADRTYRDPALVELNAGPQDMVGQLGHGGAMDVMVHHDKGIYGSLDQWYYGEHVPWNVAFPHSKFTSTVGYIFAGDGPKVMCLTYAQAWWMKPFKGVPHLPTKEFAQFLERQTREDASSSVRREFWLKLFEKEKYGVTYASPMTSGYAGGDANTVFLAQKAMQPSNDEELNQLIATLSSRSEPGQNFSRTVLPLQMTVVDLDFYKTGYMQPESTTDPMLRILLNMCMGDINALLVQTGRRLLHSAVPLSAQTPYLNSLPEGTWENPRDMVGDPVPQTEFVDARQSRKNREVLMGFVNAILGIGSSNTGDAKWDSLFDTHFTPDAFFYGNPYTLGRASNGAELRDLLEGVFGKLKNRSLELVDYENKEFDTRICEGPICGISGFLTGSLERNQEWLGVIAGAHVDMRLHFALFLNLHDVTDPDTMVVTELKVKDAYLLVDLPSAALQLGLDMVKVGQDYV